MVPAADEQVAFWDKYYKSHDDNPSQVFTAIAPLLKEKKFVVVEAALKGYLINHGNQAQPWMYEWLIKVIEAQKRPDGEIKEAIGYAAMLAKRTKNPTDLVRIADMMVLRNFYGPVGKPGYETNIGELVDLAAQKAPLSPYPPMMSVNLASKTKDSKRMAEAADQLLSLGWPGLDDKLRKVDDKIRKDLSQQVELLEKALRDDGKSDEADLLAKKVAEHEIRDVYVSLRWVGDADLDLAVEEPYGGVCRYQTPRTVFGGVLLTNGYGKHPEEVYVCPRGFPGNYTIRVDTIFTDEAKPVKDATLTIITHEGGADESRQELNISLDNPQPVVVRLEGGRRKEVLPFIPPPEAVSLDVRKTKPAGPKPSPPTPTTTPAKPATKENKPVPIR